MTKRAGPIYEVTLFIDEGVVAECDLWLEQHVREALRQAMVSDCRVFPIQDDESGRNGRVCQHVLETDDVIDAYVDRAGIEAEIASRFGDQVIVRTRILREDDTHDLPLGESPNCLNCGTLLRGQYCGSCGQRSRSRLISLWELLSDAFGDLFELDSRLWQTLVPLLARPGLLTHDYLQGRRARYMPPFRMYLVMSLIFFVVAFFDPREELSLLFEVPPTTSAPAATDADKDPEQQRSGITFSTGDSDDALDVDEDCNIEQSDLDDLPEFLARRLTVDRLTHICEKLSADEGKSFMEKVVDNIPTALIVLLPLMALVLKALYPLSRRYYVEHLLFFVHSHAFFFLILTIEILLTRLTGLLAVPEIVVVLTSIAVSIYVPIYLFVAMRRVYGQGRIVTFIKYIMLLAAYILGFSTIMAVTMAISAFSI